MENLIQAYVILDRKSDKSEQTVIDGKRDGCGPSMSTDFSLKGFSLLN